MANINVLVGSVTGRSLKAAETIANVIRQQGHPVNVQSRPELADVTADDISHLIIVVSTTGQGDLPPPMVPLYAELQSQFPMLTNKRFAIVALGDSSYSTFCQGGNIMEELMYELQAQPFCERLNIDATEHFDPVDVAGKWALNCVDKI